MNLNTTVRNSHCFNLPDPVFQTASERFTRNLITTVINILVAPNAIIANVLILVAIINCSRLRSPSNLLIASLALSDVLVGLTTQPGYISYRLLENQHQGVPCYAMVLYIVAFYICFGVSCMTLTAISFERFVAVRFPGIYTTVFSRKRIVEYVIGIWTVNILLSVLQWAKINQEVRDNFKHNFRLLSINLKRQREAKLAKDISLVAGVYLIFNFPVLLVTFYHQILGLKLEKYNFAQTHSFVFGKFDIFVKKSMMARNNLTGGGVQMETFQELLCSPSSVGGLPKQSNHLAVVNMILSLTAILGNSLILVSLRKECYLHPPSKLLYRCLATTDLLVGLISQPLFAIYWISIANEHWNLCRYIRDGALVTSYAFCCVSLFTMMSISVDRLLALLLGLRYKQTVTLKRTSIILAAVSVLSGVAALCYILDYRITLWFGYIYIPSCLMISVVSYTKIFRTLIHHQVQVRLQSSQPNSLNISRYRKAVYSALLVQLALVVCYTPYIIIEIVIVEGNRKTFSSHLSVIRGIAATLVYSNSTLNPFLYCWKINEVRQAVEQTIRQTLCRPWKFLISHITCNKRELDMFLSTRHLKETDISESKRPTFASDKSTKGSHFNCWEFSNPCCPS
ncbi:hypothetical protein pdam_00017421 [Pocillopora damicornis]|uniref:G-protein coupled receptors family 1 profile domain-containing protein n=1 Tax=Pocillopora damicornis TaxID=46731 RepID=A0A3M6V631_POCDA|nr:hypothetical protein pdam_00017421 [Pocillopora damicornis]